MKKTLLIIIDSLTARIVGPAMDAGRLPNLAALRAAGVYRDNLVSIFPSITHAALSSIATGSYPRDHGVMGVHWFVPETGEVHYFGADFDVILNKGIGNFYQDFMVDLNERRLQCDTLFQEVEASGLHAASLNFMIFHGDVEHELNLPFLLKTMPGFTDRDVRVSGPQTLFLGEFIGDNDNASDVQVNGSPLNWFGFADESTAELLVQFAETRSFPDFSLAYFPRTDLFSHRLGPEEGHNHLDEIDEALGRMFISYGGLERMLENMCIIVMGDHAQVGINGDGDAEIDLDDILPNMRVARVGKNWTEKDEVMICPNLRAAVLYFKEPSAHAVLYAKDRLLSDPRIDQAIWRADLEQSGAPGYRVANRSGELYFCPGDRAADHYGNRWDWEGDLSVVDGRVEDGILSCPTYPNAFERIAGILDSDQSGELWLTARPGHEFDVPGMSIHLDGGSHGSLHALDSLSALFVAGAPDANIVPEYPRIVDVAGMCLSVLGVKT